MSDSVPGSRAGTWFGPYRLRRLLGRGGMGEVYEAEDTRRNRMVALKLISQQFSDDPLFRARMQREAQEAGRLTEPHVVPIHDYGEINGKLFLDMRLIEGTNLATLLKRDGPLEPPRAVAITRQIASALDAAHAAGVTHRDVKPENILITGDDFAYLVDFGIARAAADPSLTQTGTAMGTYNYMAPERFTGDEVTHRADIYSLACVLAQCLTGSPPYRTNSVERAIAAHLTEPPPRPSRLRPGQVPAAFDQVVAKGMAKKPDERFASATELAAAAHHALTDTGQHQAAHILEQSRESRPARAFDTAGAGEPSTQARAWSQTPNPPTQRAQTLPPAAGAWPGQRGIPSPVGPAGLPDFSAPPPDTVRHRRWVLIGGAALLIFAAIVYVAVRPSPTSTPASGQTALPFTGIDFRLSPGGVALDKAGDVYVTSQGMYGRVVKLAAKSNATTVLPFNGLYQPQGLAVDDTGAVYTADFNNRVVKLPPGSADQTVLPFTGLSYPEGVAVDAQGSVYVADRGNNRVLKLAAGSSTPTDLPFTGLNDPDGVAVDNAGNVYITDTDNNRVLKLAAGSNTQSELPFTGVTVPWGIAVDSAGNVYVTEHNTNQVVELTAGSNAPIVLPFVDLNTPLGVAADTAGNVYVADRGNDRVVKRSS